MAVLRSCLFAAIGFAALSLQAAKDPLNDFCRRWGHQTAQVDGKLFVDGGLVGWNPLPANPLNYTNTWLLYSNLNSTAQDSGMPNQYANLTKNSTVPNVSGGFLWADEVNKAFYQFGGQFQNNPTDFSFWTYDVALNQWNETEYTSNVNSMQRVAFGAGTQIDDLGLGFYYGGWMNNQTSPGWSGNPMASSSLIQYDFTAGTLNNNTGPDSTGRAEGSMVYLPASDGGMLAYFGGVEDPYNNGTFVGTNMSTIYLFDIGSSKWYTQTASGDVPPMRRQFCSGVTWADDHSSYNIYFYGGFGVDSEHLTAFDDAYILSIPSFTWIKAFPTDNSTTNFGHGGCTANVVRRDQMIIIGGWFPDTNQCDAAGARGQHGMNLGMNGPARSLWDRYDPKVSTYFVPTPVISVIGGGPTGGATATKPETWANPDLPVYFTRVPSFSARAATRLVPTGTSKPSSDGDSKKTNVGAIAGGVIGGLVVLIAILSLILFCLHRRKKAMKNKPEAEKTTSPPPVELAATSPIHEMSSPGAAKYISMQQQLNANDNAMHNEHQTPISPYSPQPYQTSTPTSTVPYPSPYGTEYPHHEQQRPYQLYPGQVSQYDAQASSNDSNSYARTDGSYHQRQHSYSPPTSPSQPFMAPQQQQQVYYPPPPEPSIRTHPSNSDRSPEGTHYSGGGGDSHNHVPPSTTNTPAHFYAQPTPQRPVMSGGASLSPNAFNGDGGSTRGLGDDSSTRGSVDSRRRPVRGRFVEVDHL